MNWGFLSEFWDSITQVGDYTIQFFENIGKAVAGAVGNLFEYINHNISDVFVFMGWLFNNLKLIVEKLFIPVKFFYTFIKSFVGTAFLSPDNFSTKTIWSFNGQVLSVFQSVPFWSTLTTILGVGIMVLVGINILKQFRHL
jgi:hypothetical protein